MNGIVKEILFAEKAGDELVAIASAELQAGKGIVGDRYYSVQGTFTEPLKDSADFEVTLIEQEEIDRFNQTTGLNYVGSDFRRNIVTRDIRLNDLVGKEFVVGKVKLRGMRLCEPCAHLASLLGQQILQHMIHKAGLRAQIIESGTVMIADNITG